MMAPYLLRLVCLCLAAFFVIHSAAGLMVALIAPAALRAAQRMRARRAAGFLLALRLLPAALGLLLVAGLCVPSYLLWEQEAQTEEVGSLCMVAAILAACLWSASIARSLRASARSVRHTRDWERMGSRSMVCGARRGVRQPVWIVDSPAPLLALAGVLRPRLLISALVAGALSTEQLRAALLHEEAHRASRDNLKRLLLLLSPGLLPGWHGFRGLERGWSRFTEWAADDDAVAGNPHVSLSLAAALVRIARMGATPVPAPLSTSFLADGRDLSARVDRLLRPAVTTPPPRRTALAGAVSVTLAAGFLAASLHPATLESAHRLLEHLIR